MRPSSQAVKSVSHQVSSQLCMLCSALPAGTHSGCRLPPILWGPRPNRESKSTEIHHHPGKPVDWWAKPQQLCCCCASSLSLHIQDQTQSQCPVACMPQIAKGFSSYVNFEKNLSLVPFNVSRGKFMRFAWLLKMKMWYKIQDHGYHVTNLYVSVYKNRNAV